MPLAPLPVGRTAWARAQEAGEEQVVIDEMGFEPMSRQDASLFFRLVLYRYGRGAIAITTNKGIADRPEMLAGDEVLSAAILDRLLHRSYVLNISGRSYRLRELEAAAKSTKPR